MVKVLIVDSSALVRSRLGERFFDVGFDVVHAGNSDDAVRALSRDPIVAIVFDLHIDSANGSAGIASLVRLRQGAPKAVLIVLTNETHEQSRLECLRCGADFFLDKSHDFDRAVEAVVRYSAMTHLS